MGVVRWVYAYESLDVFKFVKLYTDTERDTHTYTHTFDFTVNWKNKTNDIYLVELTIYLVVVAVSLLDKWSIIKDKIFSM